MFKNIIWDYIGKFGTYLVSFLISIVLTRLLGAPEFGIMAMIMVVLTLAGVFMDMGFNRAIIQQQDISALQLSTVFYLNVIAALLLMALCFFAAAPLSVFYNQPLIKPVFQVISVSFLLNGLNLVPSALIYKQLKLKANSIIMLSAAVISGVIGIAMAYRGFGVWSLVVQSLLSSLLILIFNALYIRWLPIGQFKLAAIKPLWQYGSRMFASGLLDRIYTRLDSLIIGKIYTTSVLGYYYRAQSVEGFVRTFSAGGIVGSLFPYIAKHQNNREYIKQLFVKYLHIITFAACGLSALLFLISKDVFTFLFTARWLYAAELFQLMILAGIVWPVSSLMVSIISGLGNSKGYLKLEVYKKLVLLPVYIFGFLWGLNVFIISFVAASFICLLVNMLFVNKEIEVSMYRQIKIVLPYIILGIVAALLTWLLGNFIKFELPITRALLYTALFAVLYFLGAVVLKLKGVEIIYLVAAKIKNTLPSKINAG